MLIEDIVNELKTKSGDEITFDIDMDSESDQTFNSQWIVHKITPLINGKEAGYLKISYVPKERMKKHFPTLLNFGLAQYFPIGKDHTHWKNLTQEEKAKLLIYVILSHKSPRHKDWDIGWSDQSRISDMTEDELDAYLSMAADPKFNKNLKQRWDEFVKFHVDKPKVDFIRVNDSFQRQHVALALYQKGATLLAKKGLLLHASGLQQPEAAMAWKKMSQLGWVKPAPSDSNRIVIDPTKIPNEVE